MDSRVGQLVRTEAAAKSLVVDDHFMPRADSYVQRYFADRSSNEKLIVETYLCQAAIQIAHSEGKSRLESEDFKAAVWLFHHRERPDDSCERAGLLALLAESTRKPWERGLLLESFATHLNRWLNK
jgi:hypothetical protein